VGCFRGSLVQLASSGEILATGSTRYHLSFRKLLEWYQSQVKSSQYFFLSSDYLTCIFSTSSIFPTYILFLDCVMITLKNCQKFRIPTATIYFYESFKVAQFLVGTSGIPYRHCFLTNSFYMWKEFRNNS
jgi:hypothetical protein